jgi:polyisoprenoid-binding protein YceI
MTKVIKHRSLLLAAAFTLSLTLALSAEAAETYKLDASHTAIEWRVSHFGFSSPSGKFMNVDGTLELDEANPAASKISVTIPMESVNSGVSKLDEHLRSPDFFDVSRYPAATFTSNKVVKTGDRTATVYGDLTLHGVTKPVALSVKLNLIGENMKKVKTAGFTATTTIKRSDFGISTYTPALGDDVKIDIESEANLVSGDAAQ